MAKAITCPRTGTESRARQARGSSKNKTESREEWISNLYPSTLIWLLIHQPLPGFSADEDLGEKETHQKSVKQRIQALKWENQQ